MRVVVLTGAGISAESGIKTFRDSDGLWEGHDVMEVASPEGFSRNPDLVYEFYNLRRRQLFEVSPNPAHFALSRLEDFLGAGNFLLVTQNVDDLHERAGSRNVIHMHGELLKVRCLKSGEVFEWSGDLTGKDLNTKVNPPSRMRPHIVWFGEIPFQMDEIYSAIRICDVFLSIGTSGNVYPAAGFVSFARRFGKFTAELNLEPSVNSHEFTRSITGKAGQIVPAFVEKLISEGIK